jgi:hypothetical protein
MKMEMKNLMNRMKIKKVDIEEKENVRLKEI